MKNNIKNIVKHFVPQSLLNWRREKQMRWQYTEWQKNGSPVPTPHIVKQVVIANYQLKYGYSTLIETGTYLGDMVEAQKNRFKKIISIEIGLDLYEKAKERFKKNKYVFIVHGDSSKKLSEILKDINELVIFWLDGHYSAGITEKGDKECPIFEELDAIFANKRNNHILLIDDARLFTGRGDYPMIEELKVFIKSKNEKFNIDVKDDIIRCVI